MNEKQKKKKMLAVLRNMAVMQLEIIHFLETGHDELGTIDELLKGVNVE